MVLNSLNKLHTESLTTRGIDLNSNKENNAILSRQIKEQIESNKDYTLPLNSVIRISLNNTKFLSTIDDNIQIPIKNSDTAFDFNDFNILENFEKKTSFDFDIQHFNNNMINKIDNKNGDCSKMFEEYEKNFLSNELAAHIINKTHYPSDVESQDGDEDNTNTGLYEVINKNFECGRISASAIINEYSEFSLDL